MARSLLLLALCCAVLWTVQSAPNAAPPVAARPLRCPLTVQQLVDNAPEASVAAVRQACEYQAMGAPTASPAAAAEEATTHHAAPAQQPESLPCFTCANNEKTSSNCQLR